VCESIGLALLVLLRWRKTLVKLYGTHICADLESIVHSMPGRLQNSMRGRTDTPTADNRHVMKRRARQDVINHSQARSYAADPQPPTFPRIIAFAIHCIPSIRCVHLFH
jgi:hypothetical protein